MHPVLEQFAQIGIIPVVVIEDVKDAVPLGKALVQGGLPAAEVTFRTAAAKDAISAMAKECPGLLVGAGTILNCEQARQAIEAGAKFIVSPGTDEELVRYCQEREIPITPGCSSATDVMKCVNLGLDVVKFFPAEQAGGLPMIKALAAPFTSVRFMPTGGISPANLADYLKEPRILCAGGSWMVKAGLIREKKFDEIEALCAQAAQLKKEIRA